MKREDILMDAMRLASSLKDVGHDLFVYYYPHVQKLQIDLCRGGWTEKRLSKNRYLLIVGKGKVDKKFWENKVLI